MVERLRQAQLNDRADWVERTLPEVVDTASNASLFQTLGLDLASLTPVEPVSA